MEENQKTEIPRVADIATVAALVEAEVAAAISTISAEPRYSSRFAVTGVTVKIGHSASSAESPGEAPAPADRDWELNLKIDPGSIRTGTASTARTPTALAGLPITAVRGISTVWAGRFSNAGISKVSELAVADDALIRHMPSLVRALELRAKARLAVQAPPRSDLDLPGNLSLMEFLQGLTSADDAVWYRESTPGISTLRLYVADLLVALDSRVLNRIKLSDLRS